MDPACDALVHILVAVLLFFGKMRDIFMGVCLGVQVDPPIITYVGDCTDTSCTCQRLRLDEQVILEVYVCPEFQVMLFPEVHAEHTGPDVGIAVFCAHFYRRVKIVKQQRIQELLQNFIPFIACVVRQLKGGTLAVNAPSDAAHTDVTLVKRHPLCLFCITVLIHDVILVAEAQICAFRSFYAVVPCRDCALVFLVIYRYPIVRPAQALAYRPAVIRGAVIDYQYFQIPIAGMQDAFYCRLYVFFPIV